MDKDGNGYTKVSVTEDAPIPDGVAARHIAQYIMEQTQRCQNWMSRLSFEIQTLYDIDTALLPDDLDDQQEFVRLKMISTELTQAQGHLKEACDTLFDIMKLYE